MSIAGPGSELKPRHRAMWAAGEDSSMLATFLLPLGRWLVARANAAGTHAG